MFAPVVTVPVARGCTGTLVSPRSNSLPITGIFERTPEIPDREDIAETVMAWLAVRCKPERMSKEEYNKIINGIPNRLKVLDKAYKDYYPMKCKAKK